MKNILILCTGNSARSILGEVLFNSLGKGRVRAWSAGSKPKGEPHPAALKLLRGNGHDINSLRSKSWDEFTLPGAPSLDVVITVCDSASGESCPIWPGAPVRAHWGIADPASVEGEGQDAAFLDTYQKLESRINSLFEVEFEQLTDGELKVLLNTIGAESVGATDLAKSLLAT